METHAPTVLAGVPSLFGYLMQGISPFRETDLSCLRIVTNTGGRIPGPVLDNLLEIFSHTDFFLNYGLTESYRTSYLHPSLIHEKRHSVGKPIPGVEIRIVRDDGKSAETGETGEIVHCGDFIFQGYWGDPDATARSLRPDPMNPGNDKLALFTGDLGRFDADGFLYIEGRRDHQLKVMGVRVSSGEVEELLHASGMVQEVAIFGISHELLGEEIHAAIVPDTDEADVLVRLKRYVQRAMTQNMAPRKYLVLESLPRTTTGKTDYPALKRMVEKR
jgi:acyl-CoA synthetase (AMP-forming)/AMP-acid ligase II